MRVNKHTPIHSFHVAEIELSQRSRRVMRLDEKVWMPRVKLEGEAPANTVSKMYGIYNPADYAEPWRRTPRRA